MQIVENLRREGLGKCLVGLAVLHVTNRGKHHAFRPPQANDTDDAPRRQPEQKPGQHLSDIASAKSE